MALEAADLNDGTILQQTKQTTDARGNIQFSIELPSGRTLKSEYISKDNARKALVAWLEVVKQQAVADSNEERLARARKSQNHGQQKMDIERKPGDDQPLFRAGGARVDEPTYSANDAGTAEKQLDAMSSGNPYRDAMVNPALQNIPKQDDSPELDPLEFARQQRKIYAERVAILKDAERKLRKWSVIVETLEAEDD